MGDITIKLFNRSYTIACDDGQENRVRDLAAYVDQRAVAIAQAGGAQTDAHLLALTSIILTDEIFELKNSVHMLNRDIRAMEKEIGAKEERTAQQRVVVESAVPVPNKDDMALMEATLQDLAKRVATLTKRIQQAA